MTLKLNLATIYWKSSENTFILINVQNWSAFFTIAVYVHIVFLMKQFYQEIHIANSTDTIYSMR